MFYVDATTEYGHEIYAGSNVDFDVYHPEGSTFVKESFTNYALLDTEGTYFIYYEEINVLYDIEVVDPYIPITGFIDTGIYESVLIDNPNIYGVYIRKDQEDYIYIGNQVRFSEPGLYTIFYSTSEGYQSMTFTIVEPSS
jgi:hypothetical protein